jgi:trk system potassium uptake protein TrkH
LIQTKSALPHKQTLSPPQILVIGFGTIIFIGAFLLMTPLASANHQWTGFIDALFTATSACCVTGLVVVDTGTHWSVFGQLVILFLIQIGGLGFMTMASLLAFIFKRRISLKERLILQESLNQLDIEGVVGLVRKVLLYSISIELVGALLFAVRFSSEMPLGQAIYFGVFHSISFFNNAGFDLMGNFRGLTGYVSDLSVNLISIALVILGGIGFFVMADLIDYRQKKRLSLHTKVVLSTSSLLIFVGAVVILIFEYTNMRTLGSLSWFDQFMSSMFQSIAPRTAGINTLDISAMRQASQFFIILLMFIGASPGSTGGGIKTTTFATLVGAIIAMVRGKKDIVFFRYRLASDRILKAITLTLICLFLVIAVTMVLTTTEDHHFLMVLFEVTSAFGTVGLSMGLTPQLTVIGKILIMFMMFVGRLGPITLAFALRVNNDKEAFRYPEGRVIIG